MNEPALSVDNNAMVAPEVTPNTPPLETLPQ
jgi:hypothetical protein